MDQFIHPEPRILAPERFLRRFPTRSTIHALRAGWRPAAGIAIIPASPTATTIKSLRMAAARHGSQPVAEGWRCRLVASYYLPRNLATRIATIKGVRSRR